MKVLIAYSSWHGSTAEIAQRLAAVVTRDGITVDVTSIREAPDPAGYDAVVVGSAVHNQAWSAEAAQFVHHHAFALSQRPVWLFSVGMSDGLPRLLRRAARAGQDRRITDALPSAIQPREHRVFSGVCRPEHLPRWSGIVFRMVGGHFGDYRDWPAIEDWARHITRQLSAPQTTEAE
ncbi:Protoporphyrinogen IX dehydrogenase [menaquinone] (plasmid) [Corynebacterium occultum]|uniref:Protoporphyrinogen IX dehydrogenase [menaquinone] n=1 Tax=Corynebacterium occultum TaxID=2675219 RepID=A0A6B8W7Y9_9CORY|nr:flavodoxin domain-containing protein [Corynebacterium occultum]QGU08761.1 Protoporphyrinogen IX dehydrogenase [menaquinone] [Corynebacterium occultum]